MPGAGDSLENDQWTNRDFRSVVAFFAAETRKVGHSGPTFPPIRVGVWSDHGITAEVRGVDEDVIVLDTVTEDFDCSDRFAVRFRQGQFRAIPELLPAYR